MQALVSKSIERLIIMFNHYHQNAGVSAKQVPIETMSLETFQNVINVNLVGCFITTREAIRVFKSQTPQGGNMPDICCHLNAISICFARSHHQ